MAEKFGDFGSSFGDNPTSNNDNFDSGFDTFDEISQEGLKSPLELKLENAGLTQLEKVNFNLIEIPQEYLNNDLFINKLITLISNETVLIDNKVLNKLLEQLIKEDKLNGEKEVREEGIALRKEGIALREEGIALREENEALNNNKLEFFKLSDLLVKELNLESNPNYESWKQEATSNLLSSNPELKDNPEELESLVNSYILVENREELSKNNPELKDKLQSLANLSLKTEYSKVFENIFQSENSKVVDSFVNSQNGFTTVENDIVKASIIPDGNKAKIEGNNIVSYSGKTEDAAQIVELSETDLPKKFISKYGYKLETTQTFISDTNYQIKKQEYQTQYQQLDKDLKMSTDILNNILDQNTNALPDGEIRDNLDLYAANKAQLEGLDKNDELYELKKETLTTQIKEIEDKIKKEVLKIQQNIENINQEIQKISVSANNLQQEENIRLQNFKQLQVNADKKAEDTLDFLNNLGITNIPQVELEKIFDRLNIEQNLDPRLDLNNGFEGSLTNKNMQKEKIFNIFSKLYDKIGIDTSKLDKTKIINGNDQLFKNQDFQRVIRDYMFNENGFDFIKIFNILNSNPEKKEETPNKTIETSQRLMYA